MPIPVEKFYDSKKANAVFAVSGILLLLTLIWFVVVDYDRHWRGYQTDYMTNVAALTHLDYLGTQRASYQQRLTDAKAAVDAEAAKLAEGQTRDRIGFLESEIVKAQLAATAIKLTHGQQDALLQVTQSDFEKILARFGADALETQQSRAARDRDVVEVEELRLEREQKEDRLAELQAELRNMREGYRLAQKQYDDLLKASSDALSKDRLYRGLLPKPGLLGSVPLVKWVINMPLLDFTAPKGTPSHQSLKQLVLPDVRQRLNYLESYTTDRCITCHLAVDNKDFSIDRLAIRLEQALPAIDEEMARRGWSPVGMPEPPQPQGELAVKIEKGQVAQHWEALSDEQQAAYFTEVLSRTNQYFKAAGFEELKLSEPLRAHPDLNLFVNVDSPHPMAKMGCTVCHEGNPQETEFVLAAHTPTSHQQEHEWEEKHYVKAMGVPNFTFHTVNHYWDRPMLPPKYTEGSCVKCHDQVTDVATFEGQRVGQSINQGRYLFVQSGCINCHKVEGLEESPRVGPDLTRVASKLTPGFAERWIMNPRDFRPTTWMPHLFMQENNGPHSENEHDPDPVLRTETEIQAMVKYLFSLSAEWKPEPMPSGVTGDATRGESLFKEVGCLACHSNVHEFAEEWITKDMQQREGKTAAQSKADFEAMTYNDRAQYAWDHLPTDRDTIFNPDTVRFNPASDQNRPIFTRFAPELSAIGSKTTVEWLYAWLRNPHQYNPGTKMPSLRLTEQEASDVAAYLMSLKHDTFKSDPFPADSAHREMTDTLVFDLLSAQRSDARSRAIMADEGGELTRMLLKSVEASPNADQAQRRIRVEAQRRIQGMSLSDKKMLYLGNKMILHYGCYACHLITGFEDASPPGTELTNWAEKPVTQLDFAFFDHAFDDLRHEKPDTFGPLYPEERKDLIRLAHESLESNAHTEILQNHASFAYHKMRNPRIWDREKLKKPYDKLKMPNFYFSAEDADALVTFLMGRKPPRVTENLVPDYVGSDVGRIAAGRSLTRELNCLGCHQIEDNVATVHQYFRVKQAGKLRFDEENAPPSLRGEGAKVQHSWFYGFLQNVETLRPWLKIRMPSFDLTNKEATTLVEYFAGLSGDESEDLMRRLNEVHKYVVEEQGKNEETQSTLAAASEHEGLSVRPGSDWFLQNRLRRETKFLRDYALEKRLVTPYEIMGADLDMASQTEGHEKILKTTTFLRDLYDVPFPFVDAPRPMVSEARFKLGEEFLYELKCLKCHALGDPDVPGANKRPTAPNLNLAYRRLRQEWFRNWLENPAWIQPGTKMPQLWPDGPDGKESAFRDYGDSRAELEAKYGSTSEEQIELLLDFLYNAGAKNFTGVQPGGVADPAAEPTGDEEFVEEEEFIEE